MSFEYASLLALFGLTALNWTIHFYTHTVTYRLFGLVAEVAGGEGFVRYHQAYERQLVWSIYLPWSALVLASVAYLVAAFSLWSVILLAVNVSIAVISVAFAVPTHRKVDRTMELSRSDEEALLRANLVRLIAASASLFMVTVLIFSNFG